MTVSIAFAADAPPDPTVALERALADQPDDAVLAYYLALFRARAGNRDGALIGIQDATPPARVVRIVLAGDGRSITSIETLQSHHQVAFAEPTTAAIAPEGLYVLARTHVTQFNDQGTIDRPETLTRPQILRIPLRRN